MANLTGNIQAGSALSDPIDCSQVNQINFIGMPSDWTPALLSFQFSPDNGVTYFDVFDSTNLEVAINVRPGSVIQLPNSFPVIGKCFMKFRSGSRANPIVQAAQRTFMIGAA